jgi:L-methionine (R)-S-oxide reductase
MTYETPRIDYKNKAKFYSELASELEGLLESVWFMNLSNMSALLMHQLPEINWIGFYVYDGNELILGPFQGKPACLRIAIGKGVCGTSALKRETIIVDNVHKFEGHIACDPNSKSEIVVPIVSEGRLLGVLDIDAPIESRFDEPDRKGLESLLQILLNKTKWPATFI